MRCTECFVVILVHVGGSQGYVLEEDGVCVGRKSL
jgi:hypothetical protein